MLIKRTLSRRNIISLYSVSKHFQEQIRLYVNNRIRIRVREDYSNNFVLNLRSGKRSSSRNYISKEGFRLLVVYSYIAFQMLLDCVLVEFWNAETCYRSPVHVVTAYPIEIHELNVRR